jgi:DNA-directed RNA polymerase subunit K/omega
MMIDPPIDKLITKTPCRYALASGLAKRARELSATKAKELDETHMTALSYAAHEIYDGKITIKVEE